ncbi:Hypothetical protein R9X50_00546900 [Acrodontium crateriforme]|uniref:Major facilitator superfamily (MFS) profile domain-containing protein n=1 Tax=Acrodontium crateriforme TaxID=150365 RepID=A0AAQ3M765_9PEZI|nr:Hypothetical protein R9X50_00546900 [Acrodontium crateriforme]
MGRGTSDDLAVLAPEPVADERTPLLSDSDSDQRLPNGSAHDDLVALAAQEQREHDVGCTPVAEEPSTAKLLATMGSIWVCTFCAALDSTIVATLSTPISSEFNSGRAFSWIASGYMIANAACQPLSGKLTDIYGRRAGFVFACTFFSIGTLICGLAPSANVMIFGRIIAGMGGGCLNTVSTFIASDLIPLRKRGLWQGITNIVFGTGMGLGGIFGGFVNDRLNWRWAFYIQAPFIVLGGIIAVTMIDIPIKETDKSKIKRVDFLGAITLVTSLVLLLIGVNSGGNIVPWNHPLVYVTLPLSGIFLLLFVYVEDQVASEPIIPVRLLLNRSVACACMTCWFATMFIFTIIYYVPIYFQAVMGVSPTRAGILFIPQSAGIALGSLTTGLLMRATGKYWYWNVLIQIINLISTALILATFGRTIDTIPPFIYLLMDGFAYGSMLTITLIALISAVDHKWQAVITSASYAFRSTGSSISLAITSAVFQNLLKTRLYDRFGDLPGAADEIRRIRDSVKYIKHVPASWHEGVIASHVEALQGVWTLAMGLAVVTALVSLGIREHTLHKTLERK